MKKFLTFSTFLYLTAVGWAQSALAPPQVGFIQVRHAVHPVDGLAGNFVLGGQAASGVVSAAFSGSFGLLKSDSTLAAIDRRGKTIASVDAPPGPALFAFSPEGAPALAYFPNTHALFAWSGSAFRPVQLDAAWLGTKAVLSIAAPQSGLASLIVEREDGLWELRVRIATGAAVSQMALPGVTGPALMLATGDLVYGNATGLVVRRPDGSEKHIGAHLPKSFALQQMGEGWIELSDLASGRLFAVRTTLGHEQYYVLPEGRK